MNRARNTKKHGTLHFMVYPSGKGRFTAACLELGLVREGENPLKLRSRISTLARRYIEHVVKDRLSDDLLNQELPKKYRDKFRSIQKAREEYENLRKWQKAFESLVWKTDQRDGKLLRTM